MVRPLRRRARQHVIEGSDHGAVGFRQPDGRGAGLLRRRAGDAGVNVAGLATWRRCMPRRRLRDWLLAPGSLTARLRAHCLRFACACCTRPAPSAWPTRQRPIGLARPPRVLRARSAAAVRRPAGGVAHTVVPAGRSGADWPLFPGAGRAARSARRCFTTRAYRARRTCSMRGCRRAIRWRGARWLRCRRRDPGGHVLHARRCLYRRRHGLLLVTEVFLPAIAQLMPRRHIHTEPDRQ